MDDAEDRRRRRDSERQGQDRDGGEPRVLEQQPQAEAHVAQQVSHREPRESGPFPWRPRTWTWAAGSALAAAVLNLAAIAHVLRG
jgi:hypothetical protein